MTHFIPSIFSLFFSQLYRELLLLWRKPLSLLHPWFFFMMIVLLFPFILSQDTQQLKRLLPGLIWISALLAYLLSVDNFFEIDNNNGTLECLFISPFPLALTVFAKMLAHWCTTGLPLTLLSFFLGYLVGLSYAEEKVLMLSLLLGTPALSALGTLLGAVTLSSTSHGFLLAILLIPLAVPILIFGTGSVLAISEGISPASSLAFLAAISLTALLGTPSATATVLRYSA